MNISTPPPRSIQLLILGGNISLVFFVSPLVGLFFFNFFSVLIYLFVVKARESEFERRMQMETYNPWKLEVMRALDELQVTRPDAVGLDPHMSIRLLSSAVVAVTLQDVERMGLRGQQQPTQAPAQAQASP